MLCESEHAIIVKSNQMTNVHEKVALFSFHFVLFSNYVRSDLFHPLINRMEKSGDDQIEVDDDEVCVMATIGSFGQASTSLETITGR